MSALKTNEGKKAGTRLEQLGPWHFAIIETKFTVHVNRRISQLSPGTHKEFNQTVGVGNLPKSAAPTSKRKSPCLNSDYWLTIADSAFPFFFLVNAGWIMSGSVYGRLKAVQFKR